MAQTVRVTTSGQNERGGRKKGLVTLDRMLLALAECWKSQSDCRAIMVCNLSQDFCIECVTRLCLLSGYTGTLQALKHKQNEVVKENVSGRTSS